jgi:signal peptidase II
VTRKLRVPLLIAVLVMACDQWTKRWAVAHLEGRASIHVLGSLVQLSFTRNSGVAFGLGAGTHFPYWVFSVAAAIGIVALLVSRRGQGTVRRIALALVLGGALGNLIDRVSTGEVVDFVLLSWRHWQFPVFNLADSAVTVGVVAFALGGSGPAAEESDAGAEGRDGTGGGEVGPLPGGSADGPLA